MPSTAKNSGHAIQVDHAPGNSMTVGYLWQHMPASAGTVAVEGAIVDASTPRPDSRRRSA